MRMKFNKPGQLLLVSAAGLGVAGLMTACSQLTATLTVDFVYVTSAKAAGADNYGEVDVFEVNSESGHMRQIPTSPFPSGGRNPVAEAAAIDNTNLYVVNQDDNSIVQFIIGSDGKLYPQNTVNTPGVFPVAVSVAKSNLAVTLPGGTASTTKSSLYVADTYQPLPTCSPAAPCAGSVAVFPILPAFGTTSIGSMQPKTPINDCNGLQYVPLTLPFAPGHVVTPTSVNASADGSYLFVSASDTTANRGYLFAYLVGVMQCQPTDPFPAVPTLTLLPGSPNAAGVHPSAVTSDPSGTYVYVSDFAAADILAYTVSASGLSAVGGSPFPAGNQPSSITVDATGKFAVVANSQDSNVTTYSISGGALARIGTFATGLQPVAVGIDPRLNKYIYTANFLGNDVSGFALDGTSGNLLNTQFSPFGANVNPTAVAAIPHNGSTN
jgi:6-phosphogluconolactonase